MKNVCSLLGYQTGGVWTNTNCLEWKFVHQDPFLVAISTKPKTQHTTSKRNLFACRQLRVNWHHCAANRQHFPIDRPDAGNTKVGNTIWYHILMFPCIRWYLLFYPISLTENPWSKGHFPSQQANRRRWDRQEVCPKNGSRLFFLRHWWVYPPVNQLIAECIELEHIYPWKRRLWR